MDSVFALVRWLRKQRVFYIRTLPTGGSRNSSDPSAAHAPMSRWLDTIANRLRPNRITSRFTHAPVLPVESEVERIRMSIHSIGDDSSPPSGWEVKLFANISGSEEFLVELMVELPELVDASMIDGDTRDKLKDAIVAISVEGLMPVFEHLKKIKALPGQQIPELNRKQLFEDFTRVLWHSYKNLMQKAAKLMEPEFGFLFQNKRQFEAGLGAWGKEAS